MIELAVEANLWLKKGDFLFIPCEDIESGFEAGPSSDSMLVTLAPPAGTGPDRVKIFVHFPDLAVRGKDERWHLQAVVSEIVEDRAKVRTPTGDMVGVVFDIDWLAALRMAYLVGGDLWAAELIQPAGKLLGK